MERIKQTEFKLKTTYIFIVFRNLTALSTEIDVIGTDSNGGERDIR